jgi:hypothetical protein
MTKFSPIPERYAKAWASASFDGTWTQADLDALQVDLTYGYGTSPTMGGDAYAMYCVVTYEGSGGESATTVTSMKKKGKKQFFLK